MVFFMVKNVALSTLLFLILALAYTLTLGGHLYSPDEEIVFRATESLATRGEFAVEPFVPVHFATRKTLPERADKREIPQYGIGQPIAAIPFYWVGNALAGMLPARTWNLLKTNMRAEYPMENPNASPDEQALGVARRFGCSFFNLFVTAFSGVALFGICRVLCGKALPSFLATLMWGLGSMAWPHARTFFTEPLAGLCLLLAVWGIAVALHAEKKRSWLFVLAGMAAGYACLVRVDSTVFLPALFLLATLGGWRRAVQEEAPQPANDVVEKTSEANSSDFPDVWELGPTPLPEAPVKKDAPDERLTFAQVILRAGLFTVPVMLAGAFLLYSNHKYYGSFFASGYSDQPEGIKFSTPVLAGLYGFFMSVGKGLFFFSPALIPAIWGIRPMLRNCRVFGAGILALFVMFLLVMSAWRNWPGGWCWGPRHIMQIHALLAVPVAFWMVERWDGFRRIAVTVLLIAGAGVQVFGCSQNFIEYYRIYFTDPRGQLTHPLYDVTTEQTPMRMFAIYPRDPATGKAILPQDKETGELILTGGLPPIVLPAPINDSIYIVQNSQWTRYAEMAQRGLHDFFWLHWIDS
ncbi:TPA: hypothetical protein DDW35_11350 [Candidatus Sumerlaeota bacterium]|jgi:hypothetical protein|nr:hypothetical protein [Candidatus Sumerlaeota bacterium]